MMFPYYPLPYSVGAYDPFEPGQQSASTMEGMLYAIEPNAKFGRTQYTDVLAAYQKAGQFGVDTVAPTIDGAGAPNVTQPLTHRAWDLNSQLHTGIRTWGPIGPGYQEAQQARALAWHMLVAYRQAIESGRQALQGQRRPASGPAIARTPSAPLQAAAQTLLATIHAATQAGEPARWTRERGQSNMMWKPTADFQRAYNKGAGGSLKVDGVFGGETTAALQSVVGTNRIVSANQMAVSGYR